MNAPGVGKHQGRICAIPWHPIPEQAESKSHQSDHSFCGIYLVYFFSFFPQVFLSLLYREVRTPLPVCNNGPARRGAAKRRGCLTPTGAAAGKRRRGSGDPPTDKPRFSSAPGSRLRKSLRHHRAFLKVMPTETRGCVFASAAKPAPRRWEPRTAASQVGNAAFCCQLLKCGRHRGNGHTVGMG